MNWCETSKTCQLCWRQPRPADFLLSTDADLTDVNETTEALRQFIAPGKVMKPGAFLSEVHGWSHHDLDAISRRQWHDIEGDIWDEQGGPS